MNYTKIILISLLPIFCVNSSCIRNNKNNTKNQFKENVKAYIGKKIILPEDSLILLKDDNILPIEESNLRSNEMKIVTSINGNCHICVYNLDKWKQELIKKLNSKKLHFIFYLHTDDYDLFKKSLYYKISGDYPLLIDTTNAFVSDNDLPKMDKRFHTFLINKNNEIILVGNPLQNIKIKNLYFEEINKRLDKQ
jgi:hypothetical protein